MKDYKVINVEFLRSFTQNNPVKIAKYINMFLQSAPDTLKQMNSQLAAGDFKGLKTTAHSLKPQLGYMGIETIHESIVRIEEYAETGKKPEVIAALIKEVEATCAVAFEELNDVIKNSN
ncbi:MAG: hypothetical protein ABR94_09660 [Sphingobacteriales bacterium BACL12 MAG-120802-bin5]|jgi:HPt (histidine-containing phosphotransfer) domain-containing protein|nr:MAG: hypothetical protein ABR94_09660 [Sphingobacteriales bacterium BACL12 MAG-120802-bin5]